jgi:hypothetical protein
MILSAKRCLWLCLLLSVAAYSAEVIDKSPPSDPRLSFLASTRGLPIEYRADIVLSAVEAQPTLLQNASVQRSVRDIFELAGTAQSPYPLATAVNIEGDSVETQLSGDMALQHLDGLGIRIRAVKLFAASRLGLAYDLFWKIPLDPERVECDAPMVADVSQYYNELPRLVELWKKAGVLNDEKLTAQLTEHINSLRSPLASGLLAEVIDRLELHPADLQQVVVAYQGYLERVTASDRELGAIIQQDAFIDRIARLSRLLKDQGLLPLGLLSSTRKFLIDSTCSSCKDSIVRRDTLVTGFNRIVDHLGSEQSLKLSPSDLSPKETSSAALVHSVGPDPAVSDTLKTLDRFWSRMNHGQAVSDQAGWEDAAENVLHYADRLDSQADCSLCLFYRKFILYYAVANSAPPGRVTQAALARYIGYLSSSPVKQSEPSAWISKLKLFLNFSRQEGIDDEQAKRIAKLQEMGMSLIDLPTSDGKAVLDEMRNVRDPIMSTYYRNELLFKPKFSAPY